MKQILVYSDSLSWGIIPNTRQRLPFFQRWPGVLEESLKQQAPQTRVIENCLNGRKTVWPDPFKEGRNGAEGLAQVIEMHSPLELVIVMLGTNDFQSTHNHNAWLSAQGVSKLVQIIKQAPIEPEMPSPKIMIIAPPIITQPKGNIAFKFEQAEKRCVGYSEELFKVAKLINCTFFDSNSVISASKIDGIHLDLEQHETLGKAIAQTVIQNKII